MSKARIAGGRVEQKPGVGIRAQPRYNRRQNVESFTATSNTARNCTYPCILPTMSTTIPTAPSPRM